MEERRELAARPRTCLFQRSAADVMLRTYGAAWLNVTTNVTVRFGFPRVCAHLCVNPHRPFLMLTECIS